MSALCSISAALLAFASLAASAAPMYRLTIVDPPAGFAEPYANVTAINNRGDVAVTVRRVAGDYFNDRPMIRTADGATQLLPLPDGIERFISIGGLNDRLQAFSDSPDSYLVGYFWDPVSGWTTIVPPSGTDQLLPFGMNQLGDVVGSVGFANVGNSFSWSASDGFHIQKPGVNSYLTAINRKRQATGFVSLSDDQRPPKAGGATAMRVQLGHDPILIGDLVVDSLKEVPIADRFNYRINSVGQDINEAGTLAVTAAGADETTKYQGDTLLRACLWHRYRGLICPIIENDAQARAVSGNDQLLLQISELSAQARGTSIWSEGDLAPLFVADLLEPGSPTVTRIVVSDINESGAMAVRVDFPDGSLRGGILTPVQ